MEAEVRKRIKEIDIEFDKASTEFKQLFYRQFLPITGCYAILMVLAAFNTWIFVLVGLAMAMQFYITIQMEKRREFMKACQAELNGLLFAIRFGKAMVEEFRVENLKSE